MKSFASEEKEQMYVLSDPDHEDEDVALKSDCDDYPPRINLRGGPAPPPRNHKTATFTRAPQQHVQQQRFVHEMEDEDEDDSSSTTTATASTAHTTTTTTTTTTVTTTSQKFVRLRQKRGATLPPKNKLNMAHINEHEETHSQTDYTRTMHTRQVTEGTDMTEMADITEITEMTQTEMTQTQLTKSGSLDLTHTQTNHNLGNKHVIVVNPGDEIKCCNKIDIYTGLNIIFAYNLLIAVLLLLIVVWSFLCTDIAWLITVWSLLFVVIRGYISIFGFVIVPQMTGLHGDEIRYLKDRYLSSLRLWSVFLLYGPLIFNVMLLVVFVIYAVILGMLLTDPQHEDSGYYQSSNVGEVYVYENVDHFTAKFLLFCMGFIAIIVIIDTICEMMFYDTIKKFMEAKLQCTLCPIPCAKSSQN